MMPFESMPPVPAVEAAIARVLAAEHDAREAVAQAARQADALEERSRSEARALAERTDRRIRAVRRAFEAKVSAEIGAIEAQATAHDASQSLSPEDMRRLDRALAALAAELSGGGS